MEPQDIASNPDTNNNNEQPITPEQRHRTYSSVGLSDITSPQGRILRPPSAASARRPSAYRLGSRRTSSGWSSGQDGNNEDWSLAGRSARSPSPGRILERIGDQDEEAEGRECGRQGSTSLSSASNGRSDLLDNQDDGVDGQGKDERNDKRRTIDDTLLVENEKLRIEKKEHEKQIERLEGRCEAQESQIKELQELRKVDEKAAESRQQELTELKNSKDDLQKVLEAAQSQVIELEKEIKELRPLKEVEGKLEDAQWKLGDFYHEIEDKTLEIASLQGENKKLKSSKELLENALQKSEHEHNGLLSEMHRVQHWMEKIHEEQIRKDMEQFRECDDQVLDLMDRRMVRGNRDSVQLTGPGEEILGDLMPSRPQSQAGQSRPSSRQYSLDGDKDDNSRPHSLTRGLSDPFAMHSSPVSTPEIRSPVDTLDDTALLQRKASREIRFANLKDLRRPLLKPPVPGSRRLSHLDSRFSRRIKALNNSDLAKADGGGSLSNRALSAPVTEQERKEICERLKSKFPVPVSWESIQNEKVFERDTEPSQSQAATSDGEQPLATSIEKDDTRHNSRRPLPIVTQRDSSPLGSPRGRRSSDVVKHAPSTSPSTRAFGSSKSAVEATAFSSSFENPPSPPSISTRRKRWGEFSTVNAQGSPIAKSGDDGRSLHAVSPTSPSKSPRTKIPPSPRRGPTSTSGSTPFGTPLPVSCGESMKPSDIKITSINSPEQLASNGSRNANVPNQSSRPQSSDSEAPTPESAHPPVQDETNAQQSDAEPMEPRGGESSGRAQSSRLLGAPRPKASEYTGQKLRGAGTDGLEVKESSGQGNAGNGAGYWISKAGEDGPEKTNHRRSFVVKLAALVLLVVYVLATSFALYTNFSAFRSPAPISSPAAVSVFASSCPPCQVNSHVPVCEPWRAWTKFYTQIVTETSPVGVASPLVCPHCQLSSEAPVCESCSADTKSYTDTVTVATPAWMTSILNKTLTSFETETTTEIQLWNMTFTVATPAWTTSTSTVTSTRVVQYNHTVTETETQRQTFTLTLPQLQTPINVPRELSTIIKTLTSTVQAAPITQTSIITLTSTITATATHSQTEIEQHTATLTETHNQTIISVSTETETTTIPNSSLEVLSHPQPPTIDLPLPPPTKSFTGLHLPSFLFNNPVPSLPHPLPIPRAIPATTLPFTSQCECSCPTPAKPSPILTATQLDERAAKARKRNVQLRRLSKGPSYIGLVPEVRKWADVAEMKVSEWLLWPVWGKREY